MGLVRDKNEDDFYLEVAHALSGCQLVEQELKLYITEAFPSSNNIRGRRRSLRKPMVFEVLSMVKRYAHFAVEHLAPYADRSGLIVPNDNVGTNWAHSAQGGAG